MYRSKNFINMTVTNVEGKKLGYIDDVIINFEHKKLVGFHINPGSITLKKLKKFSSKDILYHDKTVIIKELSDIEGINFKSVKGMEIIDLQGDMMGIVEDMMFDDDFNIAALLLSTGFINTIRVGKRVIVTNKIIVGENSIIYYGKSQYRFFSVRHNLEEV